MADKEQTSKPARLPKEPIIPSRRNQLFSSSDLKASSIGWEIAIPIFSGPLIGFFLDRQFGTDVRWTMILMGLGLVVATYNVIKYVNQEMHKMNRELEKQKEALEKLKKGIRK